MALGVFLLIILLTSVISHFTLVIRRLHDIDRTGWWTLFLVPNYAIWINPELIVVGLIILPMALYLMFKKGTGGSNKYGDDPLLDTSDNDAKKILFICLTVIIVSSVIMSTEVPQFVKLFLTIK